VERIITDPEKLRETLSLNIKKQRKSLGLSQEKLAEAADLSSQTINDIEGCRMWVSDKTITKLAKVLQVEAYQLLIPAHLARGQNNTCPCCDRLLLDLEDRIVKSVRQQFDTISKRQ
jgi:transcriptional regulator with XRE-family HTH domain